MDIKQIRNMANQVESYGRYGDTELVHLNPIEVAGLASLSPTGQLTINPVTGKKEAFLPLLIPLLASWGGSALAGAAGAGAIGTAIAGGLASGVATGALTGDWERGLASGIMGAGLGGALGAAGTAASKLGEGAAGLTGEAATSTLAEGMKGLGGAAPLTELTAEQAAAEAAKQAAASGANQIGQSGIASLEQQAVTKPGMFGKEALEKAAAPTTGYGSGFDMSKISGDSLKQAIKQPWNAPEGQGMMHSVMQPQAMLPISIGGSELARLEAEDDQNNLNKKQEKEDEEDRYDAYERLQAAYRMAQPGLQPRQGYGNPYGMAAGGSTTTGVGAMPVRSDFGKRKSGQKKYDDAMSAWRMSQSYGGLSPLDVQKGLRGAYSVTPPANYRPGFDPEFMYFQDDPANIQTPALSPPTMYKPLERLPQPVPNVGINSVNENQPQQPSVGGKAGGGMVNLYAANRIERLAAGGITDVPTEFTQPPQAAPKEPNELDIQQLALALTGKAGEQADQIVQTFVQKYGPEMFTEVRKFILQQLMPNAQTEGMIKGQGGGMDDQVQGTIGGEQPVAVSPGEYIVPADVVSGIGDGSSDAGAKRLDEMQSKVRMARGGGTTQPPPIDFGKMMPV